MCLKYENVGKETNEHVGIADQVLPNRLKGGEGNPDAPQPLNFATPALSKTE